MDNELKPLLEVSLEQRPVAEIQRLWSRLLSQFQAWQSGSVSSLYGSASLAVGPTHKKFTQVRTVRGWAWLIGGAYD